jgi:hypothetical protein
MFTHFYALPFGCSLTETAEKICAELGIPVPVLVFTLYGGGTYFDSDDNTVHVDTEQVLTCGGDVHTALAHELRHYYQNFCGDLSIPFEANGIIYWRGEPTIDRLDLAYLTCEQHQSLPWEVDAINYEHEWGMRNGYKCIHRPGYTGDVSLPPARKAV